MRPASAPVQRPVEARILLVGDGEPRAFPRVALPDLLAPGDLLVANDAATIPASLAGVHLPSGRAIEVRLAGRRSLESDDVRAFVAVVFGEGDYRTLTEHRPPPPPLAPGDVLLLGPLVATVGEVLGHPRLVRLGFAGRADAVWSGIALHGRPIQYAHVPEPLALWDVWTRLAARPVAFEPPSAGFLLDWRLLHRLRERGVVFATVTHAAGLSSTGDDALDARFPLDEAYTIPEPTVRAVAAAKARGGRVVALGTSVTRALEHAAGRPGGLRSGPGLATGRLGPTTSLRVVDAIVSGTHEPGESHYELLRAFASEAALARMTATLEEEGFRGHEFGDSIFLVAGARDAAAGEGTLRARAA